MFLVETKSYGYNIPFNQFDQSVSPVSVAPQQEKSLGQNGLTGQQRGWKGSQAT